MTRPAPHPLRARRRLVLAMGAAAWLSAGCSLLGPRRSYTLQQGFWRGRIALHTEEERPQSYIATFELRGSAEQGELEVYNPLGSIVAKLGWNPNQAHLTTGPEEYASDTLDDLVARVFGTPIPVQALFAWLSGDAVQQPGWLVDLSRFEEGRISAVREQPLPRATLRVILHSDDEA